MSAANAARESRSNTQPLKIELALDMLIRADQDERFIMSFDAMQEYGDSCLHTTIATLREKGITFLQQPYKHTNTVTVVPRTSSPTAFPPAAVKRPNS